MHFEFISAPEEVFVEFSIFKCLVVTLDDEKEVIDPQKIINRCHIGNTSHDESFFEEKTLPVWYIQLPGQNPTFFDKEKLETWVEILNNGFVEKSD